MSHPVALSLAFIFGCLLPWAIGVSVLVFLAFQYFKYWLWRGVE
jgi:hypothetical protein